MFPVAGQLKEYSSWDERPAHPVTGIPADYFWERPDGKREPRWNDAYPKSADPGKCWYSVPEVAQMLGKHPATIRLWLASGALKGYRPGIFGASKPRWMISGADVEAFVRGQTAVAPVPARVTAGGGR